MGDLSANFSRHEFACKCGCGFNTVDAELLRILEGIRQHFEQEVTINSGCRCIPYNRTLDSSDTSQHVVGRAADISVKNVDPRLVQELAEQMEVGGLGEYDTFTHIDTRVGFARW